MDSDSTTSLMLAVLSIIVVPLLIVLSTRSSVDVRRHKSIASQVLVLPFRYVVLFAAFFPSAAAWCCLLLAWALHFEQVNHTHCGVANFWPSISASIGDHVPERWTWNALLYWQISFTTLFGLVQYRFWRPLLPQTRENLILLRMLFYMHTAENISLVLLTVISSTDNFAWHERGFVGWSGCGAIKMALFLMVHARAPRHAQSARLRRAHKYRRRLFIGNILAFVSALVCYFLHEAYCPAYVYSLFAIFEWAVVFTNIAFNVVVAVDVGWDQGVLYIGPPRLGAGIAEADDLGA